MSPLGHVTPLSARTCSASINLDGRVGCDCMRGQPELRADLALCFARIEALVAQANCARCAIVMQRTDTRDSSK